MPTWPATLPQSFLVDGFTIKKQPQAIATPVSMGPPLRRRRFSAAIEEFRGDMLMTEAQWDTVRTFFDNTLSGGVLSFTWVHPIKQTSATIRFKAESDSSLVIKDVLKDDLFLVGMEMEVMP